MPGASRRKRIGYRHKALRKKYRTRRQSESCNSENSSTRETFEGDADISEDGSQQDLASQCTSTLKIEVDTAEDDCIIMGQVSFYDNLQSELSSVVTSPYQLNPCSEFIQIVELYPSLDKVGQPAVKLTLTIDSDLNARLFVHRIEIRKDHDFWIELPALFDTPKKVCAVLDKLRCYSVCLGSPDECFHSIVEVGTLLNSKSEDTSAYREGDFKAVKGDVTYSSTIRHTMCKLLVQGARCPPCSKVRHILWGRKSRLEEKAKLLENSPTPNYTGKKYKHTNMDRKALIEKIKPQQGKIKGLQQDILRQQRHFRQELRSNTVDNVLGIGLFKMADQVVRKRFTAMNTSFQEPDKTVPLYMCDQCGKEYQSNSGLRRHTLMQHTARRKFQCEMCSNSYCEKGLLEAHCTSSHGNAKIFLCDTCGLQCNRKGNLTRHLQTHASPTYPCDQCGQTFRRTDTLKKHRLSMHQKRLYVCETCGAGYKWEGSLFHHKRKHR